MATRTAHPTLHRLEAPKLSFSPVEQRPNPTTLGALMVLPSAVTLELIPNKQHVVPPVEKSNLPIANFTDVSSQTRSLQKWVRPRPNQFGYRLLDHWTGSMANILSTYLV